MSESLIDEAITELMASFSEQTRFLIAFSGGMDSTVLLHALARKLPSQRLQAIYIDHGLQPDAQNWAQHCAQICDQNAVAFQSISVQVTTTARQGIEAVARQKRYQALYEHLDDQTVLLTAHHQRDQVETLLLNLARGAGITGLAAMPKLKDRSLVSGQPVHHYRPFLAVPYSILENYAQQYQLDWIEDLSNADRRFRRNFVRHDILPKFTQAWPFFEANVAQSARHVSEGLGLLNELAEIDFRHCLHTEFALQIPDKVLENVPRTKNLIRYWVVHYGLELQLNQSILQWIEQMFEVKNPQSQPQRCLAKGVLRIYQSTLFFYRKFVDTYQLAWQDFSPSQLQFWNQSLMEDFNDLDKVSEGCTVRLRPIFDADTAWIATPKKLKHWFKLHHVPVWDRLRWPVVEVDGKPVAVLGFYSLKTFLGKELPKP